MIKFIKRNQRAIIRNSFLLPILLVVVMSISHVVSWYDLGNPISWAIYLSIAIEIFALASVAAASIRASKAAIWFLFGMVTLIQIIGNVFFEYKEIDVTSSSFKDWMELVIPFFEDWTPSDHRRLLAIIQGGTLPIMSLTALHFYIQFGDQDSNVYTSEDNIEDSDPLIKEYEESDPVEESKNHLKREADRVWKTVAKLKEEGVFTDPTPEEIADEPSALANSKYRNEFEEESQFENKDDINNIKRSKKSDPNLSPKMARILKK
jgi:hypothetical protein